MKSHENIIELFNSTKEKYSSLNSLTSDDLDKIQSQVEKDLIRQSTNRYLIITIAVILTLLFFPYTISKVYSLIEIIIYNISNFLNTISSDSIMIINITSFCILITTVHYFFIIPIGKEPVRINDFSGINVKQKNYLSIAGTISYLVIILLIGTVYINFPDLRTDTIKIIKYLIFIPLIFITLILLVFFSVLIIFLPMRKFKKREFEFSDNYRYEIGFKILKVLNEISEEDEIYTLSKIKIHWVISNLYKIKFLIQDYPENLNIQNNEYLNNEFISAANEFQKCIDKLIINETNQIKLTKQSLINYANIFISGELVNLPKSDTIVTNTIERKAKIIHYIILGIYLALPIIVVVVLKPIFKIEIDSYIQSLLKILYLVWAFIGIFSNPFIINKENKDLIHDIIKTLTGKN